MLETLSSCCKISFDFVSTPAGDKVLKDFGEALPKTSFNAIRESDLCLKAPVGETAKDTIVFLRQELDLYANIRPAKNYSFIESKFSNVDMMIVRENTEDLYVGREFVENDGKKATAFKIVTEKASKRIAKVAFEMALQREASRFSEGKICQGNKRGLYPQIERVTNHGRTVSQIMHRSFKGVSESEVFADVRRYRGDEPDQKSRIV